jgi:DNA-binding GntR family transcriptional regulator
MVRSAPNEDQSVVERVAGQVLRALRNGEVVPGQRLVETETAQQLGISRPAVREAFAKLAADGVLSLQRNRGVTVRKLSLQEVREIFQVRANLEGLAARLAAAAPDEKLKVIEKVHHAIQSAADEGDSATYVALNEKFHEVILQAAGNEVLRESLQRLGNTIAGVQFRRALTRASMLVSAREHGRIVKALKAHNSISAEAAAIAHVEASLALLETAVLSGGTF